jgi:K+-sensing histidine kinase KdpD
MFFLEQDKNVIININRMLNKIAKIPLWLLFSACLALVMIIGYIDYATGTEFAFVIFYFLPIIIIAWFGGQGIGMAFSLLCGIVWYLAIYFHGGGTFASNFFVEWKAFTRLITFFMVAYLVVKLRKNSIEAADAKLSKEKGQIIIATSQRITGVVMENIAKHNSEIQQWIVTQKANGKPVPDILVSAHRNISSNLNALSMLSFGKDKVHKDYDLDSYMKDLQKELSDLKNNYP